MAKPTLNSTHLRQMAEMADGMRGMPYLAANAEQIWMAVAPSEDPDVLSIPVDVPDTVKRRRTITQITVTLDDGREVALFPQTGHVPDAIFWTESAVQKFLVPYYAAKHASDRRVDRVIRTLLDVFNGKKKKEEPHAPAPAGAAAAGEDPVVEVFAMAHLPKSEYTGETDPALALGSLAVLHAEGEEVRMESVPVYLGAARAGE
jgi:hypothetical protein